MREDRARQREGPLPFDAGQAREALAAYLAGRPEARAAFLFGSRARGRLRPSSDVDIAVWLDPALTETQRGLVALEWMGALPEVMGYPATSTW